MYSLSDYGSMIADRVRMDPYAYALKAAIRPDSVVLDIGAGTGIHALLACKFGARKVYAIEPNEAIHLAQELAQANGFADRIEFIQDVSTHVTLAEKADVVVSDLRGALPPFGLHIPSIIDARQRHLAPGGVLIPKRDTVWVALVEARDVYEDLIKPWNHPYGLAMEEAKEIVLNSWIEDPIDTFGSGNLLTKAQIWAVLDYSTIDNSNISHASMVQKVTRDGTAHGLLLWFDAEIADGITIFNGPQSGKVAEVYGRGFFPLLEPVTLAKGDTITLDIRADLVGSQYNWNWHTRIHSGDDPVAIKADFGQSTDFDRVKIDERISEHFSESRPSLGQEGEIDLFALGRMNGRITLAEIAQQTRQRFPNRFMDYGEALVYVYNLSRNYMTT